MGKPINTVLVFIWPRYRIEIIRNFFSHGEHGEIKRDNKEKSLFPDRPSALCPLLNSPTTPPSGMISFIRMIFQERGVFNIRCNASLYAPSNFLLKNSLPCVLRNPGVNRILNVIPTPSYGLPRGFRNDALMGEMQKPRGEKRSNRRFGDSMGQDF